MFTTFTPKPVLFSSSLGQRIIWPKNLKFWLLLTCHFLRFQLKCGMQNIFIFIYSTVFENKLIGLFCWNETKCSLSVKSGIACFKNVWLLSLSWNEPRWCFALRRCASSMNLLSLFTAQSQSLQNNSPLDVEANSKHIHAVYFELLKNLVV